MQHKREKTRTRTVLHASPAALLLGGAAPPKQAFPPHLRKRKQPEARQLLPALRPAPASPCPRRNPAAEKPGAWGRAQSPGHKDGPHTPPHHPQAWSKLPAPRHGTGAAAVPTRGPVQVAERGQASRSPGATARSKSFHSSGGQVGDSKTGGQESRKGTVTSGAINVRN